MSYQKSARSGMSSAFLWNYLTTDGFVAASLTFENEHSSGSVHLQSIDRAGS